MNAYVVLPAVLGFAGCFSVMVSVPLRSKKYVVKAGKCVLPLRRGNALAAKLSFLTCVLLVSLSLLGRLSFLINCIVCATGILGCEITARSLFIKKFKGVYENGIFINYPFISYDDIYSIPAFLWEDSAEALKGKTSLQIVLNNGKNITLFFESEEEFSKVIPYLSTGVHR
ncbi:hypothetical protein HRI96_01795 [Treponema parvum]|uniref:Uncharacterized protein n=1 Tax=Treponema parvum TaxID=138851 RepID=A0A975EY21_9SPIR|nr:hypothetical protein [Treponema parvum]QTQ11031.1 hypothetical protein HRI96_01795 [Treponema parvum]